MITTRIEKIMEVIERSLIFSVKLFCGMCLVIVCTCVGTYFVCVQGLKEKWRSRLWR